MKTKPQTPYAKADAKLQAENRRAYPQYDRDVAAFGRPVADFNAGFIVGREDGLEEAARDCAKKRKKK